MQTATPLPFLVPPETRRSACLAQWSLRVVFLLGVVVALASQAAAAPVVFDATASFEGASLSGTVTIDTATGEVVSADLEVVIPSPIVGQPESVVFDGLTATTFAKEQCVELTGRVESEDGPAELVLLVPQASLVGYAGSPLARGISFSGKTGAGLASCFIQYEDTGGLYGGVYEYEYPLETGSLEPQ
jgi:hypothetical protein